MYVSYDIRGIQQSIFAVPRLRYIIGASSMIDEFDREKLPSIAAKLNVELIFSGGGRGVLSAPAEQCDDLVAHIVESINHLGLDVRIGRSDNLLHAAAHADELHSYTPENLDGEPCSESGLWPVSAAGATGNAEARLVHPKIKERAAKAREDGVGRNLLDKVQDALCRLDETQSSGFNPRKTIFMRSVHAEDDDPPDEKTLAKAAAMAMGNGGRWAVLAMDGNDIGHQHRAAMEKFDRNPDRHCRWLKAMSQRLDTLTRSAVAHGVADIVRLWWQSLDRDAREQCMSGDKIVLPIRPLLIGGDDVLLICHCDWAIDLARSLSQHFSRLSRQQGDPPLAPADLWLGTDGQLTISAGIAFLPDKFPLAAGILYTEALLASAKAAGRSTKPAANGSNGTACSAPMLDWEHITEGAIDTPTHRRNRDLRFRDADDGNRIITLTCRPWPMDQLAGLERTIALVRKVPGSIRAEWKSKLHAGTYDRTAYLLRLAKNHADIYNHLAFTPGHSPPSGWVSDQVGGLKTAVLDAVELLEEGWPEKASQTKDGDQ